MTCQDRQSFPQSVQFLHIVGKNDGVHHIVFGRRLIGKRYGNIRRGRERIIARVARIRVQIHVAGLGLIHDQVSSDAAVTNSFDVAGQPVQRYTDLRSVDKELKVHKKGVCQVDEL